MFERLCSIAYVSEASLCCTPGFPISNDTKFSRVASVFLKLDQILLDKANLPLRTSKAYFTVEDLQSMRDSLRAVHSAAEKALADGAALGTSEQEAIDTLYL